MLKHKEVFCHGSTWKKRRQILMATKSTEEHGKIKSIKNIL
jgi:hypothetical protein